MADKTFIDNRHGLKVAVAVEGNKNSDNLVFVLHGLSGSMEQPHIQITRKAFINAGFTVVALDATHSFGDSGGDSIHATATTFIEDLEDVIKWAGEQAWYQEPFVIAGHSLGGLAQLVYCSNHPNKIKALAPLGTVVSGKLMHEAYDKEFKNEWRQRGYYFKESKSLPGKKGKIGWTLMEDVLRYDVLPVASDIHCPVILIVGAEDTSARPEHQKLLAEQLGGEKELHIIEGMEHTPATKEQLNELQALLSAWINRIS